MIRKLLLTPLLGSIAFIALGQLAAGASLVFLAPLCVSIVLLLDLWLGGQRA